MSDILAKVIQVFFNTTPGTQAPAFKLQDGTIYYPSYTITDIELDLHFIKVEEKTSDMVLVRKVWFDVSNTQAPAFETNNQIFYPNYRSRSKGEVIELGFQETPLKGQTLIQVKEVLFSTLWHKAPIFKLEDGRVYSPEYIKMGSYEQLTFIKDS